MGVSENDSSMFRSMDPVTHMTLKFLQGGPMFEQYPSSISLLVSTTEPKAPLLKNSHITWQGLGFSYFYGFIAGETSQHLSLQWKVVSFGRLLELAEHRMVWKIGTEGTLRLRANMTPHSSEVSFKEKVRLLIVFSEFVSFVGVKQV